MQVTLAKKLVVTFETEDEINEFYNLLDTMRYLNQHLDIADIVGEDFYLWEEDWEEDKEKMIKFVDKLRFEFRKITK